MEDESLSQGSCMDTSASSSDGEVARHTRRSRSLCEYSLLTIPEATAEEEAIPCENKRRSSLQADTGRRRLSLGRAISPTNIDKLRAQALGNRFYDDLSLLQKEFVTKVKPKIDLNESIPEEGAQQETENSPKITLFFDRSEAAFDLKRRNSELTESIVEEHEETEAKKLTKHDDFFKRFDKTFEDVPEGVRSNLISSLSANSIEEEEEGNESGFRHDILLKQMNPEPSDFPDSTRAKLLSLVADFAIEEEDEGTEASLKHDTFITKLTKAESGKHAGVIDYD